MKKVRSNVIAEGIVVASSAFFINNVLQEAGAVNKVAELARRSAARAGLVARRAYHGIKSTPDVLEIGSTMGFGGISISPISKTLMTASFAGMIVAVVATAPVVVKAAAVISTASFAVAFVNGFHTSYLVHKESLREMAAIKDKTPSNDVS